MVLEFAVELASGRKTPANKTHQARDDSTQTQTGHQNIKIQLLGPLSFVTQGRPQACRGVRQTGKTGGRRRMMQQGEHIDSPHHPVLWDLESMHQDVSLQQDAVQQRVQALWSGYGAPLLRDVGEHPDALERAGRGKRAGILKQGTDDRLCSNIRLPLHRYHTNTSPALHQHLTSAPTPHLLVLGHVLALASYAFAN